LVDAEASGRLTTFLAARRLVDFRGPHGWTRSSVDLGRSEPIYDSPAGVEARIRRVQPLIELRVPFTLDRGQLEDAARGADDIDLGPLDEAARAISLAENATVFHGYEAGGVQGIVERSTHEPITITDNHDDYPRFVAGAVRRLMDSGIGGPFGLALSSEIWTAVAESAEHGGYPLMEHLAKIVQAPIVWAPGLDGAVVLSLRGGDFVMESGEDLSVGWLSDDRESVTLYLEESFAFRVVEPDAAIALRR
jgi:uncharacterized linocin/CFP29 family protein